MKKRDLIIIASILVIAIGLFLLVNLTKKPGANVVVRVDGEYELNGGTNILHIEDGKAWLIDANCPDKLCMNQGKISYNGETITCLPNKLTVTVTGAEDDFVELS